MDEATPLRLTTDDGISLEAEAHIPETPTAGVLLAHPHPLQGGNMRSLVTSELFRLLPTQGIGALRFNFRGVEGSSGTHGGGVDESRDVVAGLDRLAELVPDRPLIICGWSFGADVALSVLDPRSSGWFLVAPPLRVLPPEAFTAAHDPRPKRIEVPEHDEFRRPDSAAEATAGWLNTSIEVINGATHFLVGRTDLVAHQLFDFVASFGPGAPDVATPGH